MTIRQFEIFLALAKTPNMRTVASKFFLSQAAVSSSLSAFEVEIGVPLFDRVNHRLVLNEKGKLLQEKLSPLLGQIKEVLSCVSHDNLAGDVVVGASTTLADFIIPQVIYDLNKKYKNVNIRCESGNTADIVHNIQDGHYNIGFVEGEVRNVNVLASPVVQERLVVVTADKEFAQDGEYSISSLMERDWLIREVGSGTREFLLWKLSALGLRPKTFMEFNHNGLLKVLLKNPKTLACLSPYIISRELKEKELFVVRTSGIDLVRTFYRVDHKGKQPSDLLEMIASATRDAMEKEAQIHENGS